MLFWIFFFKKIYVVSLYLFVAMCNGYCLSLIHFIELSLQEMPNLGRRGHFQIMDLVSSVVNERREEKR